MTIVRDSDIKFHKRGTLKALTAWINNHDQGLAEWLKNARRAYSPDRANVSDENKTILILLKDADVHNPARIGVLDVGGAALNNLEKWTTWQDPDASLGSVEIKEEKTQGNGGKAYMYKLFSGQTRLLGVSDGKLNCKGFEGELGTEERGIPGFIPNLEQGKNFPIKSWDEDLNKHLKPYNLCLGEFPEHIRKIFNKRQIFTLVEGIDPINLWEGKFPAEDLIRKTLRHDQCDLVIEQTKLYAFHNGQIMNYGKILSLESIEPYPGFENPRIIDIPDTLPDDDGRPQSTINGGKKVKGKLILYTSKKNMDIAPKKLKPRWKITYNTDPENIGSKIISELVPTTPGNQFIYGKVILPALDPDYVGPGRSRPEDGPLIEALDKFIAEEIKTLAREINDLRRQEQDEKTIDEVYDENKKLDKFKNRFLDPAQGFGGSGQEEGENGGKKGGERGPTIEWGEKPKSIEIKYANETLRIGKGVKIPISIILQPIVRDKAGRPVPNVKLRWLSEDKKIIEFSNDEEGELKAISKGICKIWASIGEKEIKSYPVILEVWSIDHVLLTPRQLQIPIGTRKLITAEVTSDEGQRSTNVLLNWEHDSDDPLTVRIRPTGWITGNRKGKTIVSAGTGNPNNNGIWSRINVEIEVVDNPTPQGSGQGFPRLLMTDRDKDPETGEIRQGDPDKPSLWQEPADFQNNVWWLNLKSPECAFVFSKRDEDPKLWRLFHAQKTAETVTQVHMQQEFNSMVGGEESPDYWARHKNTLENFQIQYSHPMWEFLSEYVETGEGLDEE